MEDYVRATIENGKGWLAVVILTPYKSPQKRAFLNK